jgi:glycerate 2-kinase
MVSPHHLLIDSFNHAVRCSHPARVMPDALPEAPSGRLFVVGAGKAAAAMAIEVESRWPDRNRLHGLVITRHGHGAPTQVIEVVEAGHPLPDEHGLAAARRVIDLVTKASSLDLILGLFSGGGSSLLSLPEPGIPLEDLRRLGQRLLNSGASIEDINCVRKHLSRSAGGKLARICRAPVRVLLISDVVGDDPSTIASGPFAADQTRFSDALAVLDNWGIEIPSTIYDFLRAGIRVPRMETVKTGDPCLDNIETRVLANANTAITCAAAYLRDRGCEVINLGTDLTDESRLLGQSHAALALDLCESRSRPRKPIVLLSGGETRVTVRGTGRGGRNTEYLLGFARYLRGHPGIHALAADTDGIDGSEENAGAYITPEAWRQADRLGLDAALFQADNNAYGFFSRLGTLVITGPTRTNVNDYRAILIM